MFGKLFSIFTVVVILSGCSAVSVTDLRNSPRGTLEFDVPDSTMEQTFEHMYSKMNSCWVGGLPTAKNGIYKISESNIKTVYVTVYGAPGIPERTLLVADIKAANPKSSTVKLSYEYWGNKAELVKDWFTKGETSCGI